MITLLIILAIIVLPGLPVAKASYANAVRTHRLNPPSAKRPARPKITLNEQLHMRTCYWLKPGKAACNCKYRDEWVELKNAWYEYENWKGGSDFVEAPKPGYFIPVIPLWPIALAVMYIKRGEIGIPDPRAVERMQAEVAELEANLNAIQNKESG